MLVFNERRTFNMLKYSDLTKRFTEFVETQSAYWERMHKSAMQLLKDLESSLDLPAKTWKDHKNHESHYVDIGLIEDGEFTRAHPMRFQGDDYNYSFAIKLVLEEGPEVIPKGSFIQHITLRGSESALLVKISAEPEIVVRASKEVADGQFADVVEAIKERIVRQLNVKDLA